MIFDFCLFTGMAATIPDSRTFLSRWGRNSLIVYLLHPFAVDIVKALLGKLNVQWTTLFYFIAIPIALLITDFLSRENIKTIYDTIKKKISLRLCNRMNSQEKQNDECSFYTCQRWQ